MVCSELAVTLQCLGKLYLGTVYSGKQRNIYEHIYKFIHPSTENPPALKTQWLKANCLEWKYKKVLALRHSQKGKHIYKDTHQRSYLKL